MVSTLFTLILVPVLFSLFNDVGRWMSRLMGREDDVEVAVSVRAAGD